MPKAAQSDLRRAVEAWSQLQTQLRQLSVLNKERALGAARVKKIDALLQQALDSPRFGAALGHEFYRDARDSGIRSIVHAVLLLTFFYLGFIRKWKRHSITTSDQDDEKIREVGSRRFMSLEPTPFTGISFL